MNKLAVFVEGYTEIVFAQKLIEEIAGQNNVLIQHMKIRGGGRKPRKVITIAAAKPHTGQSYFVLLYDCGNDDLVKERIREEHENLTKAGYSRIVGIRDVAPRFTHADIPKLQANLPKYIRTKFIPVTFILSVMEIEAWFLAESTHFPRIDPAITIAAIKSTLLFDPETDDMSLRPMPSVDLNACYGIGGKTYQKGNAQATVNVLDYEFIYLELSNRIPYLGSLIATINAFLT